MRERPPYKPNPTKDDLRDYFAPRIAVRKMTAKEAFRLQDVADEDIEKIQAYPFKTYEEKAAWERNATKKERNKMKRQMIAKTKQYALAGNSITVAVLFHLFRTLFIPGQPENEARAQTVQLSLFDM